MLQCCWIMYEKILLYADLLTDETNYIRNWLSDAWWKADRTHGSNLEKSRKYQLLAIYFNVRMQPESFTKELGTLSHPELLLCTKITPVRLSTRNKHHHVKETKICTLPHLCTASKQRRMQNQCCMCIYRQNTTIFSSSTTGYLLH